MAYTSTSDVAAYCSNLITGASNFSASTIPTNTSVCGWIVQGTNKINVALAAKGFAPPTNSSCDIYSELQDLNTFYTVARAEIARTNVRLAPGERTRGQVFQKYFDDGLKELLARDMSRAGLTYTHLGYVGGISVSDKESVVSNGDRAPMRFSKNQFKNPRAPTHLENDQSDDIEVRQ